MAILLRCNRSQNFGQRLTVEGSGRTLHCARGNELTVRVAIFDESGAVLDLTDHASLNLAYMPASRTASALALETATIEDATFTEAQWQAGTHYHAEFTFSEGDMNPDLDSAISVNFWLVLFGIKTVGGGEVTHGGGILTVEEDGTDNTVDAPDPPEVGVTAAQVAAMIGELVDEAVAEAISELEGGIVLNNFAATTDPGVGDDSADGYAVGSVWINTTLDRIWQCQDATSGAAVWERIDDDEVLNNYTATTDPGTGDDSADGYSVGSRWVNTSNDRVYTCADASVGAAVWVWDNEPAPAGNLKADASVAGTGMQELLGLNFTDPTELTIASGSVTATQSLHSIDTEGDAASDDLDTVTAAKGVGDFLVIFPAHTDRTVVIKHNTGNIKTATGSDLTLDNTEKGALLFRTGASWMVWGNVVPATFDPASPGAIGGTTPAAGTFTTLIGTSILQPEGQPLIIGQSGGSSYGVQRAGSGGFYYEVASANSAWLSTSRFSIPIGSRYTWGTAVGLESGPSLSLGRAADNVLEQGMPADSPAAQTLKAPNATGSNNQGGAMKIAGGAGHGTGAQGDVELEGNEVILDAGSHITCDAPIGQKQYTYSTVPAAGSHTGRSILVTDAGSDSGAGGSRFDYEEAVSNGTYWRYKSDGAFVGGV